MTLRRSDPSEPGITRVRRGRGFRYHGPRGEPVTDPDEIRRIKELVVPPGWHDVWICPFPEGHIQACGTDDAGRRQYVYHREWRRRSEEAKYDRMLDFAEVLPGIRDTVAGHLRRRGLVRERVLAAAVRLVDLGFLRAGGDAYAARNDSYGVASLLREHVHRTGGTVVFEFPGKSGREQRVECAEPEICRVVSGLQRVRSRGQDLFAYRVGDDWHDVTSDDLNSYLRDITGEDHTLKEFRTWHATVLAAVGLAVAVPPDDDKALARLRTHVVREVADYLGNTEAVARSSYIDPRVFRLHERGVTIAPSLPELGREVPAGELATQGEVERTVLRMLREHGDA
ncbi:DNA topoisomerase IB [Nocardiopsis arvandica]|uniref:DNA topoisomerase n=1 Tax=Nocardiopsis sinuspersici TaxID=501010 RepID=A0A7Y9XAJ7_9ACTN|nr:DNA topoisomerase IB [Nocardiopsis sinuspersici]NYH52254.1 DNA topoisomerase IB [Nocardiopsis sinuspersici]